MLETRVIPCLLLNEGALVKSVRFDRLDYIGDPLNAVRIFNEFEVDELLLLDISASPEHREPSFDLIADVAAECFMPLSYGGGISSIDHARRLFALGIEKVAVNTAAFDDPTLVSQIATEFGSQSLIVSLDAKRVRFGGHRVFRDRGNVNARISPEDHARRVVNLGAGELLVTSIDQDGTWEGYDVQLVRSVADSVDVPIIASGGAGALSHFADVVDQGGASAVATGSMVVYQKKGLGVLISFPSRASLNEVLR